jgi:hypothetical protein
MRSRCERSYPGGVPEGERRLQVDHVAERLGHAGEPIPRDPTDRLGLDGEDRGPGVLLIQARERGRADRLERLGHRGVEPAAGAVTHHRERRVRAAQLVEDHGLRRGLGDPSGQRDVVTLQAPWPTLAVPALGVLVQGSADPLTQPESVGHQGRNLADRAEDEPVVLLRAGHGLRDVPYPPRAGALADDP